jgi:hypothetical protein
MLSKRFVAVGVVCAVTTFAQDLDLRGAIRNQARVPVAGLTVRLSTAGMELRTDEHGAFAFVGSVAENAVARGRERTLHQAPRLHRHAVHLSLDHSKPVSISIFDFTGSRLASIRKPAMPAGRHRIPLSQVMPPHVAGNSMRIVRVTLGSEVFTLRTADLGRGGRHATQRFDAPPAATAKRAGAAALDQLIILRRDSVEATIDIDTYDDSLSIMLDLVPYEIVEIAVAEEGRGPSEVGKDLESYPFKLDDYYTGSRGWCSEFVSWAYVAAGYPFTGGRGESWLLEGSTTINLWFQNNERFVSKDSSDWATFVPAPGDYIRYDNEYGGHSGIVRYADGTTLYTIEGNVNNQVMARRLRDWKERSDVDGIGMRSGFREDTWESVPVM